MRYSIFSALLAGLVIIGTQSANAASVLSLFQAGANNVRDDSREYLIDRDVSISGAPGFGVQGQIDPGDSLRGMGTFSLINSAGANAGGLTGNNEFTVLFQTVVTGVTDLGAGISSITFAPDPLFEATWGTGAMAVFFEDGSNNYTSDFNSPAPSIPGSLPLTDDGTTLAAPSTEDVSSGSYTTEEAFIGTATDGTQFWTLGFTGAAGASIAGLDPTHPLFGAPITTPTGGEGWNALSTVGDNVLPLFGITPGSQVVNFNFGVSRLVNGTAETGDGLSFNPVPTLFGTNLADFAGSGSVGGVLGLDTAFEASNRLDLSFNLDPLVPEPATFGMWLTLAGAGFLVQGRRRRRS